MLSPYFVIVKHMLDYFLIFCSETGGFRKFLFIGMIFFIRPIGIDFFQLVHRNLRILINYDLPRSLSEYLRRLSVHSFFWGLEYDPGTLHFISLRWLFMGYILQTNRNVYNYIYTHMFWLFN